MLRLKNGGFPTTNMTAIHSVVRALGKGLKAFVDMRSHEIPNQILEFEG